MGGVPDGAVPTTRPAPPWPIWGGRPITTVVAVTVPSLFLVPCTPMKSPTLTADALDVVPPFGPGLVLKVVLDEETTVTEVLAFVSTVMCRRSAR